MELFAKLFSSLLVFVYHCFDRIVINGYLSGLCRPEQVVWFFHEVLGIPVVSKEVLSQRTSDYQHWVEAYARNHRIPIQWAEKGVRKEDYVLPSLRRMEKKTAYGVYFIFKSMEQGRTFRISRMVKKVMRPPCGSTSGDRLVAPCSALCLRGNPPVVQLLEKAEHFLYLDGFSLDGSARRMP